MSAFKQFLKSRNLTLKAVSDATGIPISTVHRAAEGKVVPNPDTIRMLREFTAGAVTADDFHTAAAEYAAAHPKAREGRAA